MSNLPTNANRDAAYPEEPGQANELNELRSLLIGPDLKGRFENAQLRSEDVSRVLPEAIQLTLKTSDETVSEAVMPTVEHAIKSSVNTDQNILSEALFPIMGPAIRKAIAAAIQNLTDSLNQSLEHSLSPQSLSWRFEAWRTGKSFAEVLLLRTLVYQVEQVFLIHKSSGLVLQHLAAATAAAQDADLVSAMFTAIQDFVRDSFSVSDEALGSLQVGELTIWVNEGPQAIIACVIRGNPPGKLRQMMENALERIHLVQERQLHEFQGDSSAFEPSQPYLEECLQSQYQTKKKRSSPLKWIGGAAGILILGLGVWGFLSNYERNQVQSFVDQLNRESGIVVLQTKKQNGKYVISGLKDPLASKPTDLISKTDLDPNKVAFSWEPYLSFDTEFIESRVISLLQPPETVELKVDANGAIQASGTAPQSWITEAKQLALRLPNVTQFNTQQIVPVEAGALADIKAKLEAHTIFFTQNAQLVPQQDVKLKTVAEDIKKLAKTAKTINQTVAVLVEGHTDTSGSELINLYVRETRAKAIISLLSKQGIDKNLFQVVSVEPPAVEKLDSAKISKSNRKVTFKVIFVQPSDAD
ncbi:OmpA family protein [Acaryochloris sp. CCMEE 5410]|uniref:OmpA family protein n=1 Tax=Acaryochloris sp. CCMEE 5410 TaxID=310037 RepID=UPI0002483DA9|nr:OmpA family protein [Acaryochloris sp. CCMEE 5410]KAI9134729.1 OmpA family protein [Acaryochloris sp. CCMEE 5410]